MDVFQNRSQPPNFLDTSIPCPVYSHHPKRSFDQESMNRISDFETYDGLGLADLVRRREVQAVELLDAVIERIEALNPKVNTVVTRMYDQARKAIKAGLPVGPFTGVPFQGFFSRRARRGNRDKEMPWRTH
jgi:hypothetical protein